MSELQSFPNPFINFTDKYYSGENGLLPYTLMEIMAINAIGCIKSKPEWRKKILDFDIYSKWEKELQEMMGNKKNVLYILEELKYDALFTTGFPYYPSCVTGVWESQNLIPDEIRKSFEDHIKVLEKLPEEELDWHPGSNHQVLDLVHPSLYCLVSGRTVRSIEPVIFDFDNSSLLFESGKKINLPKKKIEKNFFQELMEDYNTSDEYQWIPSEVKVKSDGKVSFKSYINNLNPITHSELYPDIEKILEFFVPMFEKTLENIINVRRVRHEVNMHDLYEPFPSNENEKCNSEEENEIMEDYLHNRKPIKYNENFGTFRPPPPPVKHFPLKNRKLQVIVKIAKIILNPQDPSYPGGSWHVEGMKNENIVATGIYYWKMENITESRLMFRQSVCDPYYEQDDHLGVKTVFGIENDDKMNQQIGYVKVSEGKCITFPNIYQHCVAPFELKDKTKGGTRNILVFFLVDPTKPIISTSEIPPQQKCWYENSTEIDEQEWLMSREDAEYYRERLMEERKKFIKKNDEIAFSREFSLCEH